MGTNEILGLKSIADFNKKSLGEKVRIYTQEAWYFEKWYEKLMLIAFGVLAMWKIVGFF